jgi:hypothetical protein
MVRCLCGWWISLRGSCRYIRLVVLGILGSGRRRLGVEEYQKEQIPCQIVCGIEISIPLTCNVSLSLHQGLYIGALLGPEA